MFLDLIHQPSKKVFQGKRSHDSGFGHTLGGATDYSGLSAFSGQPPVHLLLRLNTADPAVGVTLPGAQWLPLLCAVRYGACGLGYRVVSDREVIILFQAETKAWDDFPYNGYPERLPSSPLMLEEGVYDPSNPENALHYAGVFGYDSLSPEQFAAVARHVEKNRLPDIFGYESGEDYLREGNSLPFARGPETLGPQLRQPPDHLPDLSCLLGYPHNQSIRLTTSRRQRRPPMHLSAVFGQRFERPLTGDPKIIKQRFDTLRGRCYRVFLKRG